MTTVYIHHEYPVTVTFHLFAHWFEHRLSMFILL